MKNKLQKELVSAMKDKDTIRVSTIRSMISALTNEDKVKGKQRDEIAVLSSLAKQRQQSIDLYRDAGKDDLMAQETVELSIIEEFLPQKMDESQIRAVIAEMISHIDDFNQRKMGMVIGQFNSKYPGQDGKTVATIIKSFL